MLSHHPTDLDYSRLVRAAKRVDRTACKENLRVALMGDAATQQFVPLLTALLGASGFSLDVYEGGFDATELDVYNEGSALYRFRPDAVVLLNCVQSLRSKYYDRPGSGTRFAEDTASRLIAIWDALRARLPAVVVQSNFAMPYERQFGNFDHKVADSFYSVVAAINTRISEASRDRPAVLVNDVEAVASYVGRRHWFDERFWDLSKTFCAPAHLPRVALNLVEILLATKGRVVKCVALDLDNTLWGGVIGDDGVNGIALNAHGDGEAFHRFQSFLRELKARGIVLAVCSKNDHANAVQPFRDHPEMVLKEEDITVFVANWQNKVDNLKTIRATLDIGFDSIVFLDDNPFERNLVRELLPEVIVPELPEDPADYVRALSELNLFEAPSFSGEDLRRTQLYQQEAQRKVAQAGCSDINDFLRSLDMRIEVARFDPFHLPRVAQLTQRSNQFNLTTNRYNEAECDQLRLDEAHSIPLYAKLGDRFGDHGLISVVVLRLMPDELFISDWLMSCRVLARGVEDYLMSHVVRIASRRGLSRVTGEYVPSPKNGMVKEFYARFGFGKVEVRPDGRTLWAIAPGAYTSAKVFIRDASPGPAAAGPEIGPGLTTGEQQ